MGGGEAGRQKQSCRSRQEGADRLSREVAADRNRQTRAARSDRWELNKEEQAG